MGDDTAANAPAPPPPRIAWFQASPENLVAKLLPPGNTILGVSIMPNGNICCVFEGVDAPLAAGGEVPQMVLLFSRYADSLHAWFAPIETAPSDAEAAADGIRRATDKEG